MRKLATLIALSALVAAPVFAASAAPREVRKSVPLDAGGTLTIDTYKGSITVTAADGAQVEITARIEADGAEAGSAAKVDQTEVRIGGSGSAVTVETDYSGLKKQAASWFGGFVGDNESGALPFVHYTVRLPKGAALKISDYKSTIDVSGVGGDLDLETYKGTATLKGLSAGVRVNTYKGNVRAEIARLAKDARLETYKGEVDIRLPAAAAFTLDADTGKGSVTSAFDAGGKSGILSGGRVGGKVNGGGPAVRLTTHKGTFRLQKM